MSIFIFALGIILATLLAWFVADRRARAIRGGPQRLAARILLGVFFFAMAAYPVVPASRVVRGTEPASLPTVLVIGAYIWMSVVLPALLVVWSAQVVFRLRHLLAFWKRKPAGAGAAAPVELRTTETAAADSAPKLSRRDALRIAGAALPPLATCGLTAAAIAERGQFRIRNVTLLIASLPADLDGLTICHLTDLHAGNFMPAEMLPRIADAANALKTDLVVFTGDIIDRGLLDRIPDGMKMLGNLDRRHGFAMIEGNHDVQSSVRQFREAMRGHSIPLLLDSDLECRVPGRATPVQLLGIHWATGADISRAPNPPNLTTSQRESAIAASVRRVAALRKPGAFPILLAHHPHAFDAAAVAGIPLTLSGHSHGGQVMLTRNIGAGPLRFRYWSGEHERNGSHLVISNGLGSWFPLRVNAPAEMLHITLRKA